MTNLKCDAARVSQNAYLAQVCAAIHAGAQVVMEFCKAGTHRLVHGLCVLGFAAHYVHQGWIPSWVMRRASAVLARFRFCRTFAAGIPRAVAVSEGVHPS